MTKSSIYRQVIDEAAAGKSLSYRAISAQAGIHPSYFSRVMLGRADFNAAQAFRIGSILGLAAPELDYLLLQVELESTPNEAHRQYLQRRAEPMLRERQRLRRALRPDTPDRLDNEEKIRIYYAKPLTARVLMRLTIPRFQESLPALRRSLRVSEATMLQELEKLARLGLAKKSGARWLPTETFVHLDERHPASAPNHLQWRLEAIERLRRTPVPEGDYHLSVCFSATDAAKQKLRELFREFVVRAQAEIAHEDVPPTEVCFMNFDLVSD